MRIITCVYPAVQCAYLLFGQLSGCKSLNDISLVLKAHEKHLYQMGFPEGIVDSSSLSRANESRDYRIYEDLGPLVIANIYRNRWQIETFFKWIMQNLTIKALWGYSKNAVQTQLWVAKIGRAHV